jgi:hypothetical protein
MRIILDESVPHYLKKVLSAFDVTTVQDLKLAGIKNGLLLKTIDGQFDVFVTADKNLKYQQNLKTRRIAIIEIHDNKLSEVKKIEKQIIEVLSVIEASDYIEVKPAEEMLEGKSDDENPTNG